MDVRELRNSVEILKGQKRAIVKERDGLRERLEEGIEDTIMGRTTEGPMMMNGSRVYDNNDNKGNGIKGNNNKGYDNNNNDDSKRNSNRISSNQNNSNN